MAVERTVTLSPSGSTRASLYPMSNKILTLEQKTHIAWLDSLSDTMICAYDHAADAFTEPLCLGTGRDNHGGPAVCADREGFLYVVFGPHHGPFQFMRSVCPNDASQWERLREFGDNATYPSLVCDADNTLHIAYRGGGRPRQLVYQRKPEGDSWSKPRVLVDAAVPDGYTQFGNALTIANDSSLHMAWHIYDVHPERGKAAGHIVSRDAGDAWELMDGTVPALPVTPETSGAMVEEGDRLDMRAGNVVCDAQARPYFPVLHYEDPTELVLWRWRDGWVGTSLRPFVEPVCDFAPRFGEAAAVTIVGGRLYVAAGIGEWGQWEDPSKEMCLLASDDLGETFGATRISTPDPRLQSWGAALERPVGHNTPSRLLALWTHGSPGESCEDPTTTEVKVALMSPRKA